MDRPFHLVLVNGFATPREDVDGNPHTFFSQVFPRAIIDEFAFLETSNAEWHLQQRAHALLEQLWKARGSSKPLPLVFLAHGLGGFVVKQALVSAVEEPRYRGIALHASAAFFFGVPHRAFSGLTWEYLYLRLLSTLPMLPSHLLKFTGRLVEEIEDVSARFTILPCMIHITDYYEQGKNPVVDRKCYTLVEPDNVNTKIDWQHEEFWDFSIRKAIVDDICRRLLAVGNFRNQTRQEFLGTLSLLDPQTHQLYPSRSAVGVLDSVTNHGVVEAWRTDPKVRVLHVCGIPGSGTTVLAKQVLKSLLEQQASENVVILTFSFDKHDFQARGPFNLYLSLCRQLLSFRPKLFGHVSSATKFWTKQDGLTTGCLWILLCSVVKNLLDQGGFVFCIIRAIDECITSPAETLKHMEELVSEGNGRFKLLLSRVDGKHEAQGCKASQCCDIEVDPASNEMMSWKRLHVQSRIRHLNQENASWSGLENLALDQVQSLPANSTYLVIELNMALLEWTTKSCTKRELKERLQEPPKRLRDCYNEALRTIKAECRTWVLIALRWIAWAVRPLTPGELAVGVAVGELLGPGSRIGDNNNMHSIDDMLRSDILRDLRHCMAPLVKVEENRVRLIHDTFRVFLFETASGSETETSVAVRLQAGDDEPMPEDQHCRILHQCLEYLKDVGQRAATEVNSYSRQNSLSLNHEYGLLGYATRHWPRHFQQSTSQELSRKHVLHFLKQDERVAAWADLYRHLEPTLDPLRGRSIRLDTPLKIVCNFGLTTLLNECIESAKSMEDFEDQLSSSLDLAAEHGHHDAAQTLLCRGARSPDALGLAASGGFVDLVKSFLSADPSGINKPDQSGYAPLHRATCSGQKHVISLLLEKNADPDVQTPLLTGGSRSASGRDLFISASGSDPGLDSDTDTDDTATDRLPTSASHETSLQLAAGTGQREIAENLLRKGANVHAESSLGYDALMYAAGGGSLDIVDLLLDDGADVNKSSKIDGNTALHLAAAHGHVKVVERLLRSPSIGPNLTRIINTGGLSPIDVAAREGHLDVLNSMFGVMESHKGTDDVASTEDEDERPPSSHPVAPSAKAPESSHTFHLRPRPRRRSTTGLSHRRRRQSSTSRSKPLSPTHKSALEWAAENGHSHVVQALLAREDTVNLIKATKDRCGNTALHVAAKKGYSTTVETLLKSSRCAELFPVNSRAWKKLTPLHMAAKAGHVEVVKTLLRYEAQPDLEDEDGKTALHHAATHGHLKCLDELRPQSDPRSVDNCKRTALHLAARRGHFAVVERLCEDQDTIWMEDEDDAVALDFVVERGEIHEVERFVKRLKNGIDEENFAPKGLPLHVAARLHHLDILKFLLSNGWKCDARDSDGSTPLHVAALAGFQEGVELLLYSSDCDVNAVDLQGNSPIHRARGADLVKTLLKAGAKNDEMNDLRETPLFLAAYRGDTAVLEVLLNSTPSPDVNATDGDGWSALHAAFDCSGVIKLLLDHFANPNVVEEGGRTPLALAIRWRHLETARVLLNAGADPNVAESFDSSPLGLIPIKEHGNSLEMVKLLAEHDADLLAENEKGDTILHLAAREGQRDVVNYIIERLDSQPAYKDRLHETYGSALCEYMSASDNFDPETAKKLVAWGLDVNNVTKSNLTALQAACARGTVDAVRWLLSEKAQVNAIGGKYGTALCAAVESEADAEEKVLLLLDCEAKADVNLSGEDLQTALQRAVSQGNGPLVDLLLKRGANVNISESSFDTPLNYAITNQGIGLPTIDEMLKRGADVNKAGLGGKLPVHLAAIQDRLDVMQALCNAGADARVRDGDGLSPLMQGLLNSSVSVVRYLVSEHAYDPDECGPNGQTPLMVATILGDRPSLILLLEAGFEAPLVINARDFQGKTALAHAVCMDHLDFVETLIKSNADPSVPDYRDNTPLYWATRMASQETTEMIIKAMENLESDMTKHWSIAIHGAVASSKREALERLLRNYDVDPECARPDGWTPLYTALRYRSSRMESILLEQSVARPLPGSHFLQRPSRWHPKDTHPGIAIDARNPSVLSTVGGTRFLNRTMASHRHCGVARADYPMIPLINDHVYYFEVNLTAVRDNGMVAIGFCEDCTPLNQMLGWDPGAWGFHSDDGKLYDEGLVWRGLEYDKSYGETNVTVGCGVNFANNTAFYTKDGTVIGRAFDEIRGKLYPAVSMDFTEEGWRVTAVFPEEDGKSDEFVFKGDFDDEQTLARPQLPESKRSSDEDSESSSGDGS